MTAFVGRVEGLPVAARFDGELSRCTYKGERTPLGSQGRAENNSQGWGFSGGERTLPCSVSSRKSSCA